MLSLSTHMRNLERLCPFFYDSRIHLNSQLRIVGIITLVDFVSIYYKNLEEYKNLMRQSNASYT